jgi:serine/threonine protein kinase
MLAAGGVGVVFKAYEQSLDRYVAIKFLSAQSAGDAEFVQEFFQEARAVAKLNHANIIHIYFVGEHNGLPYFAMELVEGENLQDMVFRRGKLPLPEALKLIRQAAVGLQHAHQQGVIHRDIKPSNLILAAGGVLKVADFGLAKNFQRAGMAAEGFAGTPEFTSPEEASCQPIDHRTDIYSLGITLYFLLAGQAPFTAATPEEVLQKQISQPLPSIQLFAPTIPTSVTQVLNKMLHKQPSARYQSCDQLARDLDTLIANKPLSLVGPRPSSTAKPPITEQSSPVFAVLMIILAIGTGALLWKLIQSQSATPPPAQPTWTVEQPKEADAQRKADATVTTERTRIQWEELKSKAMQLRTMRNNTAAIAIYERAAKDFSAFPEIVRESENLRRSALADQTIQRNREANLRQLIGSFDPLIIHLEFEKAQQEVQRLSQSPDPDLREGMAVVKQELNRLAALKNIVIRRYQHFPDTTDRTWNLRSGQVTGRLLKADTKEILVRTELPSGAIAEANVPWTELPPATATDLFMRYIDTNNADEIFALAILQFRYATNKLINLQEARQTLESVTILDPGKKNVVAAYLKRLDEYTAK